MAEKLDHHLENIAQAGGMVEAFQALTKEPEEDHVSDWAHLDIAAREIGNKNALKKREALGLKMNAEQIEQAKELARKLIKKPSGQQMGLTERRFDQLIKGSRKVDNRQKNIKKAVDLIDPLPEPDHALHCLMGDDFNAWELVPALMEIKGAPIDRLFIGTLGFNKPMMKHLAELVEARQVGDLWLLCSHYFQATDKTLFRFAVDSLRKCSKRARVNYARSHAKIIAMEIGGEHYVMEGSANLRACNNVEQITIFNSRDLFEFHADWIKRNVEEC
jgi:hypothetical protein